MIEKKLSKEDIRSILTSRFIDDKCNTLLDIPHPDRLKDIKKASKRVKEAILRGEKIAIVGDYDADGVISSAIMMEFFDDIGADAVLKIPNRFEDGYGINEKIIDKFDVDLIITVDNGISAVDAAKKCKQKGIDLIVTDHHNIPKVVPNAYAIINPKQKDCTFPNHEICGAQVAWYFIASIKKELNLSYDLSKFLDILSIAIVADMMELTDINRTMVKSGLKSINRKKRPFLKAIGELYKKSTFKSDDISFLLAPLINSSGRVEDATLSYELIRAKSISEAIEKLEYIVNLNQQRKLIEQELFQIAVKDVDSTKKIIIAWGEDWHEGVIGIVASRLVREYKRPAIVFSIKENIAKGSARSIGDIDILKCISKESRYLLGYGGHKGAAGLSIEIVNLEKFKKSIEKTLLSVDEAKFIDNSEILGEIDLDSIDFELIDILEYFEPYGQKNPKPHFLIKNVYVQQKRLLGENQNHQKLTLVGESKILDSIEFNFNKEITSGKHIDLICTISKNEFKGKISPQILIKEIL